VLDKKWVCKIDDGRVGDNENDNDVLGGDGKMLGDDWSGDVSVESRGEAVLIVVVEVEVVVVVVVDDCGEVVIEVVEDIKVIVPFPI